MSVQESRELDSEATARALHEAAFATADGDSEAADLRRSLIQRLLAALMSQEADQVEWARAAIDLLIVRANRFAEATLSDQASVRSALALIHLEDDLGALERALNLHEKRASQTEESRVSAEISWVESQIEESACPKKLATRQKELQRSVRELEESFAFSRAERIISTSLDEKDIPELEHHLAHITTIRALLKDTGRGERTREFLLGLHQARERTRSMLDQRLEADPSRPERLKNMGLRAIDRLDDRLSSLESLSLSSTVRLCGDEIDDLDWLTPKLNEVDDSKWVQGKLKRRRKRLMDEIEERRVQQRLERKWGRRSVAFLERMVLVLILLVLALLTVQSTVALSPLWNRIFLSVDAAICGVFLMEYLIKAFASPTSWRYARRHFLLDFVPSIPFDLILQMSGLDVARSARAARLARLPRFARYLRAARPLIRFVRVLGFLLRGMDRLVRRQAPLLNMNVVLFEDEAKASDSPLSPQLARANRRCRGQISYLLKRLPPEERLDVLQARVHVAQSTLSEFATSRRRAQTPEESVRHTTEVTFPSLVESLSGLDSTQVRGHLASESAEKLRMILRYFSLPIVRHFPILGKLGRGTHEMDEFEATAHAGRVIGLWLQRILELSRSLGDLWGVVTAPRLLDRLGGTLAKATKRPAYRLLIFGVAFLLLQGIIAALSLEGLEKVTDFLAKLLGTPILILGGICLGLHHFGRWLQKLAGEATETFRRIAEAQFINLLNERKRHRLDEDLTILYARALSRTGDEEECQAGGRRLKQHLQRKSNPSDVDQLDLQQLLRWNEFETIKLLFLDYLDGAVLHQSNHKTSEQLLGNLSLQNIRDERMRMDKKKRSRLAKLDLSQRVAFTLGPNLWFYSITSSLAEQTAKLLLDYNRNAIPKTIYHRCEAHDLKRFREWLGETPDSLPSSVLLDDESLSEMAKDTRALRTTQFHALHFLSADPNRDAMVKAEFGPSVARRLIRDRRSMIRYVFGHFPYHSIPKPDRTINPYDLYWDYLGGGRVLLLPFVSIFKLAKIISLLLRLFVRTIRSLLHPEDQSGTLEKATTTLAVARRKIARMRHPIYMECLNLRADFDPEYLACRLPILGEAPISLATVDADLDQIQARDSERRRVESRRGKSQARLDKLGRWLEANGINRQSIEARLHSLREKADEETESWIPQNAEQSIRALCIAFTLDYDNLATRLLLREDLQRLFDEAIRNDGAAQVTAKKRPPRWWAKLPIVSPSLRRGLSLATEEFGQNWTKKERRACHLFVVQDIRRIRSRLRALAEFDSLAKAEESARELAYSILENPLSWRRQLITVRALQTLSWFDLRDDCHSVEQLAELGEIIPSSPPIGT